MLVLSSLDNSTTAVDIKLNMKLPDSYEENHPSGNENDDGEEPIIQLILQDLPGSVSSEDASALLHSMAASKNILFWAPNGEMIRNQRRIPGTNMTELVEYVLLPFTNDLPRPNGLNSFIEGLAELGINKSWIGNKQILSDILDEEEIQHQEKIESGDGESDDDESEEESDDDESNDNSEQEEEEEESDDESNDESEQEEENEPNTDNKQHCSHCGSHDADVKRTAQCPRCKWEDRIFCKAKKNQTVYCPFCSNKFHLTNDTARSIFVKCDDCKTLSHNSELYDLQ